MALMPKRVKHRKSQRGRIRGNATRGNRVVFGDFGLQATQGGWLSAATMEAGRIAAQQYLRTEGRLYVRVFPHKPITSIPLETRMGKGKGEPGFGPRSSSREPCCTRSAECRKKPRGCASWAGAQDAGSSPFFEASFDLVGCSNVSWMNQ